MQPALDRPNLKVLSDAYVNKIITTKQGESVVATAVEFEHGGAIHKVSARKEVIVSAGYVFVPRYQAVHDFDVGVARRSRRRCLSSAASVIARF